jgi:hypothetical protein
MTPEQELAVILRRLELPSEARVVLSERFANSIELARVGEVAIALENVCDNLFDFSVELTLQERDAIGELCARSSASSAMVQRLDALVSRHGHLRVVARVGGLIDETRVTLGIHGEELEPGEISRLVGCQPSRSHRRGDARPTEELIGRLLDAVADDAAVWGALRSQFTVRLGLGLFLDTWNRGFDVSSETILRIARVAGSFGFDIYADGSEGED